MEELISLITILMLRDQSNNDEVVDVAKPGSMARDGKEMLVGESVVDISCTWNVETR